MINWPILQNPQNHSARYNLGRRIPFAFPAFFSSINRPNLQNPQNHSAIYYFGRRLASQPRKPQCTLFMAQATSFLKVSKSRKQFLEFSILSKTNEKHDKTIHWRRKCEHCSLRPISYFWSIWGLYVLDLKAKFFCRKENQLHFPTDKGLTVSK